MLDQGSDALGRVVASNYLCPRDVNMLDAADEAVMNYLTNLQKVPTQTVHLTRGK